MGHAVDFVLDGGIGGMVPSSIVEIGEAEGVVIREGAGDCSAFL
jgi:tRNA A37 threonylcarbamoyladenosine synthetase subunit TsaC/SUA5/YrdC